jgi:hypothetical protein
MGFVYEAACQLQDAAFDASACCCLSVHIQLCANVWCGAGFQKVQYDPGRAKKPMDKSDIQKLPGVFQDRQGAIGNT